jgi:hypothetical protein
MLFERDLGIPLSALDIERYSLPQAGQGNADTNRRLHPKDEALLAERPMAAGGRADGDGGAVAGPGAAAATEVSWLMRTKYITNEAGDVAAKARAKAEAAATVAVAAAAAAEPEDRAAQIAAIERSFEASRALPVHQTKPELTPVEVLPGEFQLLSLAAIVCLLLTLKRGQKSTSSFP